MDKGSGILFGSFGAVSSSADLPGILTPGVSTDQCSPGTLQISTGFPITIKTESIDVVGEHDQMSLGSLSQSAVSQAGLPGLLPLLPLASLPKVISRRRPYLRSARTTSETCVCEVRYQSYISVHCLTAGPR